MRCAAGLAGFVLVAAVASAVDSGGAVFVVEPRALSWEDLDADTFDPGWFLPDRPSGDDRFLLDEMRALAAHEFDLEGPDGARIATLGDFLSASRGRDLADRTAWWRALEAQAPEWFAEWGERLYWLTFDDALFDEGWSPEREHPRDGIAEGPDWRLRDEDGAPWSQGGAKVLHQAAIWIDADLAAIKEVESDFDRYPDHAGADYEAILPYEGGAWRGADAPHGAFAGARLYFRCDLPFPFGDYECDLRMLHRRDAEGRLVTDIYSPSRDFRWLAGRDVFLPLATGAGEPAGHLLVRVYGFDLSGVPDKETHRRRALRASLGNLRRNAEAHARLRDDDAPADDGGIPPFTVRGRR